MRVGRFLRTLFPRVGLVSFLLYICIMHVAIYFLTGADNSGGGRENMLSYPVMVPLSLGDSNSLLGTVRNCLGDRVAGATVTIDDGGRATTDERGRFLIKGVASGQHRLVVEAPGYRPLETDIRVCEGENDVYIGYERGLWPDGFHIDFHVFYNHNHSGITKLFGQVGVVNGADEEFYVLSMRILDPDGVLLVELLDHSGREQLAKTYPGITVYSDSKPGICVKPGAIMKIEIPPQTTVRKEELYSLVVIYADKQQYRSGRYARMILRDTNEYDENWDPHR